MPAFIVLGFWVVLQLVSSVGTIADTAQTEQGGVAYMAHVGGFVAGIVLAVVLGGLRRPPDRVA
jgi:membrane associated rhomboid family serine protease